MMAAFDSKALQAVSSISSWGHALNGSDWAIGHAPSVGPTSIVCQHGTSKLGGTRVEWLIGIAKKTSSLYHVMASFTHQTAKDV